MARIGISGWRYPRWRGTFYPKGLPQHRELEYASGHLNSVEINGTFYSLQRPSSFRRWREETPPGFVFSVKGGRYITHLKGLKDVREALANFYASGVLGLGDKLGPFLWQLPERATYDAGVMEKFLAQLPRSTQTAAALAAEHTDMMKDRTWIPDDGADRPLRHAVEIRSTTFITEEFYDQLRRHNAALVLADSAGKWPMLHEITADFIYVRLHGKDELYAGGYPDSDLDRLATAVSGWLSGSGCPDGAGRDAYLYFDNDAKVHAPFNALGLAERLGPPQTYSLPPEASK